VKYDDGDGPQIIVGCVTAVAALIFLIGGYADQLIGELLPSSTVEQINEAVHRFDKELIGGARIFVGLVALAFFIGIAIGAYKFGKCLCPKLTPSVHFFRRYKEREDG
jgi:hypothetical protein